MFIPEIINLKVIQFPTYYIAVLLMSLITQFVIWLESVKDGFDKEKIFDLYFLSLLYLVGLYFLFDYLSFYHYYIDQYLRFLVIVSFAAGTLAAYKLATKKWSWSIYRFLDIFSFLYFALSLMLFFAMSYQLGEMVNYVYLAVYTAVYLSAFFNRNLIFSGLAFSIYLLITAALAQVFFRSTPYLIFYLSLITISIVNLVFRSKQIMAKNKFSFDFIAKIKGKLLSKDKRLKEEQQRLIEDDPYLQEGRDVDNAEEIDEAILEDRAKEEIEIKKENIKDMQKQISSALGRIEEGNYGICVSCGEQIDKARLEAYPEATKCLKCSNLESANA